MPVFVFFSITEDRKSESKAIKVHAFYSEVVQSVRNVRMQRTLSFVKNGKLRRFHYQVTFPFHKIDCKIQETKG